MFVTYNRDTTHVELTQANLSEYTILSELNNLESLIMIDCEINLNDLEGLTKLKYLELLNCRITGSLECLSTMYSLRTLLIHNGDIETLSPIKLLTKLEHIRITTDKCSGILLRTTEHLKYLVNLEIIWIDTVCPSGLNHISKTHQLKELYLSNSRYGILSLVGIKYLTKLEVVRFIDLDVPSISILQELPNIKGIHISDKTYNQIPESERKWLCDTFIEN